MQQAIKNGAKSFISVKRRTNAASSCGFCRPIVKDIITETLSSDLLKKNN
ncbi:MAG: (2Fe-2S)-binding protein [Candidatus Izimaplasma sp.]|nr:(2Fe-2S)-binding protein [Candidatus Izimaplasma bacterium]